MTTSFMPRFLASCRRLAGFMPSPPFIETIGLVPISVSTSQVSIGGVPASQAPCIIIETALPGWSMVTLVNTIFEPIAAMKASAKCLAEKLL